MDLGRILNMKKHDERDALEISVWRFFAVWILKAVLWGEKKEPNLLGMNCDVLCPDNW